MFAKVYFLCLITGLRTKLLMRKDTNNLKFILTITPFLSKSNTKDWNLEETRDNGCTDTTDIVTIQFSFRAIYILMLHFAAT